MLLPLFYFSKREKIMTIIEELDKLNEIETRLLESLQLIRERREEIERTIRHRVENHIAKYFGINP